MMRVARKIVTAPTVIWVAGLLVLLSEAKLAQSLRFQGSVRPQAFAAPGFTEDVVVTLPVYQAVGLTFAPDGRLFIWQKNGQVRIFKNGALLPTPFLDLAPRVNGNGEQGLMGLALDRNFATNGFVYLLYVYEGGGAPTSTGPKTARLSRVQANPSNPDVALAGSEVVLLGKISDPPCSKHGEGADCMGSDSGVHSIGTVRHGPDGKLYVGMGDSSSPSFADVQSLRAQNLNSYNGKILRLNPDGTAPSDNPFYDGNPNSVRSKVYAYGLRNPFRFAVHPVTSEVYIGDVGSYLREEINRGRGKNFGWPCYEGNDPHPGNQNAFAPCQSLAASAVTKPLHTYERSQGTTVIGGTIYNATSFPAQYRGNLFFADYSTNFIRRLTFDASGNLTGAVPFATGVQSPVALELGPDGALYYVSFTTGQIRRIRYSLSTPVAAASAARPTAAAPYTIAFSSRGSNDPNGSALTYAWEFGDGQTSTAANPTHSYPATGVKSYTVKLTVTNPQGASDSDTITITVGSRPPVATITAPANGTRVKPGETVTFRGTVTDADETLPSSALTWTVLLHHDTHVHPFRTATGASSSFVAEDHGTEGTYFYEIILTAKDSSGLTDTKRVNVTPVPTTTTLPTPWKGQDVGSVGSAGSAAFANGLFTLKGAGEDIARFSDGFYFAYQPLVGDGEISARVTNVQDIGKGAKAGVMIRAGLATNAAHALMSLGRSEGLAFERRLRTGYGTTYTSGKPYVRAPYWVRLTRQGSVFRAYKSADGKTWVLVGTATINSMPTNALIGLVVTSNRNTSLCTAQIDNVTVRP
jgi:glucose/arabinose dehydrogenase